MKMNQLKIGIVLSYITMIVQNIIFIVYTPIMLRLLGQSEYGLYQLVYSVVSYLGLLSFGFGSAYVKFFSRYRVKDDELGIAKLNGIFIIVFTVISIITLIAGNILVSNVDSIFSNSLTVNELKTARVLMVLMVINLAISFPSSVFDSYVTAHECYFFQRMITLLQTVFNPFLTLPLLLMGYKSVSLVVVTTMLTILKFMVNFWYCTVKIDMNFCFKNLNPMLLKEIGLFSFYIFINMVVDQINWSVDKFILGVFGGTTAVAIYSVGGQINSMYMNLSSSISSVFIPRINKIVATNNNCNNELTELFTKVGRIQFIVLSLILGGFFILGKFFINLWAGPEYKNAYYVALLLIIPVTIPLIQNLGIEIQKAKNMHQFRSVVYILVALGNIAFSIPLTYHFGEIGAAIGTSLSLIIGNIIVMNWYYEVKIKLNMYYYWKQILYLVPPIFISIVVSFFISKLVVIDSLISFLFLGVIYIIIYGILMYLFGMNDYEKKLIINPINNLIKRGSK